VSDALKYHEYFSGVSMASVALRPRWQCTFANDIDPIKAAVYRANWGHGITVADIASIRTSDLPPDEVDMSWVSFPCQDTSIAGAGAGLSGTRSGAFWGYARLTAQLKAEGRLPKLIVLENVTGLITSSGGADFVALCTALQDLGYRFGAIVVDALDFLPQSRPRIFIIAILRSLEIPARLVGSGPSAHFTPTALRRAVAGFPPELAADWIWWILPTPPPRNSQLIDLLVDKAPWDALSKTDACSVSCRPRRGSKSPRRERAVSG
jgi:DNA (cytosine-5)-methyltransferase 1